MVQKSLVVFRRKRGLVSSAIAISAAKALIAHKA